ncbi:hypothetical protein V1509DRAFT_613547 [Lipomyces kononenkoae]
MPAKSKKQITGAKNVARRFQIDTDDDNKFTEDFYCVRFDDETNGSARSAPDPLRNALSSLHYFEGADIGSGPLVGTKPIKSFFTAQTSGKLSLIYTYNSYTTLTANRFSCLQWQRYRLQQASIASTLNNEPSNLKRGGRLSHEEYSTIIDKATVYLSDKSLMEYEKAQVRAIVAYFQGLRAG